MCLIEYCMLSKIIMFLSWSNIAKCGILNNPQIVWYLKKSISKLGIKCFQNYLKNIKCEYFICCIKKRHHIFDSNKFYKSWCSKISKSIWDVWRKATAVFDLTRKKGEKKKQGTKKALRALSKRSKEQKNPYAP